MQPLNQPDHYLQRERDQRAFAERAKDPEISAFHTKLAEHYRKLAEESRSAAGPRAQGLS